MTAWGTIELAREWWPTATEPELEAFARAQRLSGSPNAYRQIEQMNQEIDVRHALPSIAVPALVLHRAEDHLPVAGAEWMAAQIPGARFVRLPGGPEGKEPRLSTRLPDDRWVFLWDGRLGVGYLLVMPRGAERRVRFQVEWQDPLAF